MKFLSFICLAFLLLSCNPKQKAEDVTELFTSETLCQEQLESSNADVKIVEEKGQKMINVKSRDGFKSEVIIHSPKDKPWDLSQTYQVKADVSNTGKHRTQIELFIGFDPDPLMRWYCSTFEDLEPGETKTITVDLTWLPWVHKTPLDLKNMRGVPGKEKTDRKVIQQVSLIPRYPSTEQDYTISRLYAVGKTEVRDTAGFLPFVDQYGQYKHDEWKDKVHSDKDLLAMAAREQEEMKKYPKSPDVNQYGGWASGPKQKATGFFRTEKVGGKWWMVDPEGCLFWSAGVNCVSSNSVFTNLYSRENYFEGLPKFDQETASLFSKEGKAFNHYNANLKRLFGKDYWESYAALTHQRLASWGMNTIGFMSDNKLAAQQKTPYVGGIWIRGTRRIVASKGYAGPFHDVFDADFEKHVRASVEAQKFGANDPWCLGFYIDNEMSWGKAGSLSLATLQCPADQPAKQTFIKDLKEKYRTIDALNAVWGTKYASWGAMLQSTETPDETKAQADLYAFYDKLARKYFKTVHDELARVAPHQNYMGCRLAWAQNDITLHAAADYCDIISFNKYEYSVEHVGLPEGIDCPIIIGEFHFGALDRGMFHKGVIWADSQEDRGEKYKHYIQGALRNDFIVGAHWFQYLDEPITGRFDGENYNVGLINVVNVPFSELIEKIRETCYDKYDYRYGQK